MKRTYANNSDLANVVLACHVRSSQCRCDGNYEWDIEEKELPMVDFNLIYQGNPGRRYVLGASESMTNLSVGLAFMFSLSIPS